MKAEILPHLWIGSLGVLQNSEFLSDKNIKGYLNLEKDLDFLHQDLEYQGIVKQNIFKYRIIKLAEYLKNATQYIHDKLSQTEGIILVSRNGYSKCDYIIIAYLIRYARCSVEIVKKMLEGKIGTSIKLNSLQDSGLEIFIQKLKK